MTAAGVFIIDIKHIGEWKDMFRQAKTNASKVLAGLLAVLMLLSTMPGSVIASALAAEVSAVTVQLPVGVSATVTMTDEADAEKVFTAETDKKNYRAVLENLDDGTTYTLRVSDMVQYRDYTAENVKVDSKTPIEVKADELEERADRTISFAQTELSKTFGDAAFQLPAVTVSAGAGEITYTSSNENVAAVTDAGMVTITGAGETKIKVTVAPDDQYKAAEDTLTLKVAQADNAISYAAAAVNWPYDSTNVNPLTIADRALEFGRITYESRNTKVATVDKDGNVKVKRASGQATITATYTPYDAQSSAYKKAVASYTVYAEKKLDGLSYDKDHKTLTVSYGDTGTNVPSCPEGTKDAIRYSTDHSDVITLNEMTGEYTVIGIGTATITATLENDNYNSTASYTLKAEKKTINIDINPEITYGEQDPDISEDIKKQVTDGLIEAEKADEEIIKRVAGRISYAYPTVESGLRQPGTYAIDFTAENDDYYTITFEKNGNQLTVSKKTIEININPTINYGEQDPDISEEIKTQVTAGLVEAEQADPEIIKRVAGRISYKYPEVESGLRQPNQPNQNGYMINYWAEDDACYTFNFAGELTVNDAASATGEEYNVAGLIENTNWGRVDEEKGFNGVTITPNEGYYISDSKNPSDWAAAAELTFTEPQAVTKHEFYVRDMNTGKVLKADESFGIDGSKPVVKFVFPTDSQSPQTVKSFLLGLFGKTQTADVEKTNYGYFFHENTNVTVRVEDAAPSSGVMQIEFYTVDVNGTQSDTITASVNSQPNENGIERASADFTVKADFKGQIYAKAVDNVGNTDKYVNPDGVVIESPSEHEENAVTIVRLEQETDYKDTCGHPLFSYSDDESDNEKDIPKGIPVTLSVKDTISGIASITWSVTAGGTTKSETLDVTKGEITGGEIGGWKVVKTDKNLVTEMHRTIYVTDNSNDIEVKLWFADRAGNNNQSKAETLVFSIDNTPPSVEVSYDNTSPDAQYTDFYNADRVATVKVTERNFNENAVLCSITNTDGTVPTFVGEWEHHTDPENPDKSYHTRKIVFHADGDYTVRISCEDLAGNVSNTYTDQFTIDQTLPTVSVAYDNMNARNGNYYNADRTATITIVEHNFDAARVHVIGTASDNGAAASFPALSGWSTSGDTHTATIRYAADAKYDFDIEFRDMAGNSIADYAPEEFYVDKTAPTLEISGVEDKSANNGTVAPVISFTDTNFDEGGVTYTLVGISNGTVNYSSTISNIPNGQQVTFADFEKIQQVDDIYTLTATLVDKAGNETTKSITFSANRFGSVYDLSRLQEIIGKYLQSEEDIVFTETNVDSLKTGETKIKLIKNGTPIDLVEGKDYTVAAAGGGGLWSQYIYTLSKALFADDGRYSISVYSVDMAGNINENIDETKKAEISFGIDKTNPVIVPIDFESNTQYPVKVKTVSVEIKDNLVLDDVKIYLNDAEVEYRSEGETYTFDIPEKNGKQNVRIVAVDAAGNTYELLVENFLVSTNVFVRWFNNTPLFVGSIVGVAALCGVIIFLVASKRRKQDENTGK